MFSNSPYTIFCVQRTWLTSVREVTDHSEAPTDSHFADLFPAARRVCARGRKPRKLEALPIYYTVLSVHTGAQSTHQVQLQRRIHPFWNGMRQCASRMSRGCNIQLLAAPMAALRPATTSTCTDGFNLKAVVPRSWVPCDAPTTSQSGAFFASS